MNSVPQVEHASAMAGGTAEIAISGTLLLGAAGRQNSCCVPCTTSAIAIPKGSGCYLQRKPKAKTTEQIKSYPASGCRFRRKVVLYAQRNNYARRRVKMPQLRRAWNAWIYRDRSGNGCGNTAPTQVRPSSIRPTVPIIWRRVSANSTGNCPDYRVATVQLAPVPWPAAITVLVRGGPGAIQLNCNERGEGSDQDEEDVMRFEVS